MKLVMATQIHSSSRNRRPKEKPVLPDPAQSTRMELLRSLLRGKVINPEKLYSKQEASELLRIPIPSLDTLLAGAGGKPLIGHMTLETGEKVIPGRALIKYVRRRIKNSSRLDDAPEVRIPHKKLPSLCKYKKLLKSIKDSEYYPLPDIAQAVGILYRSCRIHFIPKKGRLIHFQSEKRGKFVSVSGKEYKRFVLTFASLPLERESTKEMMEVLLVDTLQSLRRYFYTEGENTWLRYRFKKQNKVVFYPLYKHIDQSWSIEKEHLDEIRQDISTEGYMFSREFSKLTGRKQDVLKYDVRVMGGKYFFIFNTLTSCFMIPVSYVWKGELMFHRETVNQLLEFLKFEEEKFRTTNQLADAVGLNRSGMIQFINTHREGEYCVFPLGGKTVSIQIMVSSAQNHPNYFTLEDAQLVLQYYERVGAKKEGQISFKRVLDLSLKTLDRGAFKRFEKELTSVDDSHVALNISSNLSLKFSVHLGCYYAASDLEEELAADYFRIFYGTKVTKLRAVLELLKEFEGKAIPDITADPKLSGKLRILKLAIERKEPEVLRVIRKFKGFALVPPEFATAFGKVTEYNQLLTLGLAMPLYFTRVNGSLLFVSGDAVALHAMHASHVNGGGFSKYFEPFIDRLRNAEDLTRGDALLYFVFKEYGERVDSLFASKIRTFFRDYAPLRCLVSRLFFLAFRENPEDVRRGLSVHVEAGEFYSEMMEANSSII